MSRFSLITLLLLILVVCFSRDQQTSSPSSILAQYQSADKLYREANRLSEEAGDNELLLQKADRIYSLALQQFTQLLPMAQTAGRDSLVFYISSKAGYISYLFDSTESALQHYRMAIAIKQNLAIIPDSFLFTPLLYTGGIFYARNEFDSALHYYKKAEEVSGKYTRPLGEAQRLYNRLGVMFYETGNYRQARNYFDKALAMAPPASTLRANYQLNIASLLVKLEELEEAKNIYGSLLPLNVFNNEINHNLGIISLKQKQYREAAGHLSKVSYTDKKNIDLYYNKAMAYSGLHMTDSAEQYLHKGLAENLRWNGHRRNTAYGLLLKFQADELAKKGIYKDALPFYQQSIIQFDRHFSETDINKNPEQYSAVYSYINLFNTLTAKGDILEKIYQQEHEVTALAAALYAYRSAFKLADHVERTYTSDEARLFIGKIKHAVHSRPIDIGIQLFRLTQKKEYLEEVYFFDQRNKASVLSFNIQQQGLHAQLKETDDTLFKQEAAIKSSITRLSLKAAQQTDSTELSVLEALIRDKEIGLGKIREAIDADPQRQALLATERIPAVNQLHRQLDNTSAILSYHLSEQELLILLITANRFEYFQVPINRDFHTEIESFRNALYHTRPEERYNGTGSAMWLYRQLISPAQSSIAQLKRLIIIPDDELNYLPFEALQDPGKKYLFEKFAIQYQYSSSLLGSNSGSSYSQSILSLAPFTKSGYSDSASSLSRLPASADEVKDLPGKILLDSAATRENFLLFANHNAVVHLATHALADNQAPERSYISFYPGDERSRLYAQEIYDLRLDSTSLVILSACETGSGQLVKGEGMMSLSRAFAYAGCPNIITSLWKAEDKVTAFITQRLHYYLSRNETKDKALQLAKSDLLKTPDIDPALKSPNFWAHLILIGEYEPDHKRSNWPWVAIGIVLVLLTYYYIKRRNLPAPKGQQA